MIKRPNQPAEMRTWHEDGLVLGGLLGVLMLGLTLLEPQRAPTTPPTGPIVNARIDPDLPIPDVPVPVEPQPDPQARVRITPKPPIIPPDTDPVKPTEVPPAPIKQIPTQSAFITLFGQGADTGPWYLANHNNPTGFWRNDWRKSNVISTADGLSLSITDKPARDAARPWTAGEISTNNKYGYGRYEAVMRPAKGSGLVSSFFTYTGPWFGDPHDEIDVEFMGKDTTRVEFNLYVNGRSYSAKVVDLTFDAAEDFHLYAFDWHPDKVTWYIDGVEVHSARIEDHPIPSRSGKIMMNVWTGKMDGWHGRANFPSGVTADYACVSYRPMGAQTRTCSTFYGPEKPSLLQRLFARDEGPVRIPQ